MIISRTPFRVSFFGGGTDYPEWFSQEGGAVLSTTIDKYLYITARYLPPFFEERHRIVWSRVENVVSFEEIQHPVIRKGLQYLGFSEKKGLDIHYQADLPARTGVGSSSAFAVGFINAMMALKTRSISKEKLAKMAIHLEREVLQETVGCQDQIASAYGGINRIEFSQNGQFQVERLIVPRRKSDELEQNMMLFYTGVSRYASKIASNVVKSLPNKKAHLYRMRAMVDEGFDILNGNDSLYIIGELLDEAWNLKKDLHTAVTSNDIDQIYSAARSAGASGGKLLGAGGSGFMLFFVRPENQSSVRKALQKLLYVPFRISWDGSNIMHYDPLEVENEELQEFDY